MIKRFRAHLHYNGIINAEKGDSLYYINDKKDSEGNIITPGDTIVFRHTDRRYVGYMLAIRVPLQNYNSTPVVKVTGFTDHEAFEANAYMYGMMGADNDGDTAGLVALSKEQLEALAPTNSVEYERLKQKFGRELTEEEFNESANTLRGGLYAGNLSYYDKGYLEKVYKDLKDPDELVDKTYSIFNFGYQNTGKKTYIEQDKNHNNVNIRPGFFKRYMWHELYWLTFINDKQKAATLVKNIKSLYKTPTDLDSLHKSVYLNSIIRYATNGYNVVPEAMEDDEVLHTRTTSITAGELRKFEVHHYKDDAVVEEFYKLFEDEIQLMFFFDTLFNIYGEFKDLNNIPVILKDIISEDLFKKKVDDKTYIPTKKYASQADIKTIEETEKISDITDLDFYQRFINNAIIGTITNKTAMRISTSKAAINRFGSLRKLTTIMNRPVTDEVLNTDKYGSNFDPFRDEHGFVSVASILDSGIYGTAKQMAAILVSKYNQDKDTAERTSKYIYNYVKENKATDSYVNMLLSYRKALIDGKVVDIDKVIAILNKLPIKDDPNIVEFIAYLRTQENIEFKENKNDYVHVQLKRIFFGRMYKYAKWFFDYEEREEDVKDRLVNMINGKIMMDRAVYNMLDSVAQKAISLAKHYGLDMDAGKFYEQYEKDALKLISQMTKGFVNVSISDFRNLIHSSLNRVRSQRMI